MGVIGNTLSGIHEDNGLPLNQLQQTWRLALYKKPSSFRQRLSLPTVLILLACAPLALAQTSQPNKIMAGYFYQKWSTDYAHYSIANIEKDGVAGKLTYLIYAFGNVTPTSTPKCAVADPEAAYLNRNVPSVSGAPYTHPPYGSFGAIEQLRAMNPNLKVLISLGGEAGNVAGFTSASATSAGRAALVSSCINLFIKGQLAPGITAPGLFDGFNVDWEFPTASDKENFTALLKEFRTQLNALSKITGKKYVLTFDSPAQPGKYANIDLKAAATEVDFLTIDGYDYAGPSNTYTEESSPLYGPPNQFAHSVANSIDETVQAYLRAGVPPAKYTMGFPLYAVGWTGVRNANHGLYQKLAAPAPVLLASGTGICPNPNKAAPSPGCDTILTPGYLTDSTLRRLIHQKGYIPWYDSARVEATLFHPATGTFYSYDNLKSIATKVAYIKKHKLGGAYVWALGYDNDGAITKALAEDLK